MSLLLAHKRKRVPMHQPHDVQVPHGFSMRIQSGNIYFRGLVRVRHEQYVSAPTEDMKTEVARKVVKQIEDQDPPGRFVMRDTDGVGWLQLPDSEAMAYTCESLQKYPVESGKGKRGYCRPLHGHVDDFMDTFIWVREAYKKQSLATSFFLDFFIHFYVLPKFDFTDIRKKPAEFVSQLFINKYESIQKKNPQRIQRVKQLGCPPKPSQAHGFYPFLWPPPLTPIDAGTPAKPDDNPIQQDPDLIRARYAQDTSIIAHVAASVQHNEQSLEEPQAILPPANDLAAASSLATTPKDDDDEEEEISSFDDVAWNDAFEVPNSASVSQSKPSVHRRTATRTTGSVARYPIVGPLAGASYATYDPYETGSRQLLSDTSLCKDIQRQTQAVLENALCEGDEPTQQENEEADDAVSPRPCKRLRHSVSSDGEDEVDADCKPPATYPYRFSPDSSPLGTPTIDEDE